MRYFLNLFTVLVIMNATLIYPFRKLFHPIVCSLVEVLKKSFSRKKDAQLQLTLSLAYLVRILQAIA